MGTRYIIGEHSGKHTGTVGLLGCLSFNGNKIITTGGGGIILTDDEELANKARYLTTQAKDDRIKYIHNEIGYNFRLTNIQAALGVAQLEQLPGFLKRKQQISGQYKSVLLDVDGLTFANVPSHADNNHWMNVIKIDSQIYGEDRDALLQRLDRNDIKTRPVWALNHQQKSYENCQTYKIENAPSLLEYSLCLPSSSNLSDENINRVFDHLRNQ